MEETEEVSCPPQLFNIYTNDQHLHNGTRSVIYADDLCVTAQQPSFVEVETTIKESRNKLTQYYRSNNLRANPDKPQVTAFHLRNKENVKSEMKQDRFREPSCYVGTNTINNPSITRR